MSVKSWNINPGNDHRFIGNATDSSPVRPQETEAPRSGAFRAQLSGFNQVPPVLSRGSGTFRARVIDGGQAIEYQLTYDNLSAPASVAHIHFGHPTDNGSIFTFLCGGGDTPACPGAGGTVTGVITADDILAIPAQGVPEGDFAAALRILRAGLGYVNIHNANFPDGEIRGQIRVV